METLITTHAHVDFDAMASVVAAQKLYPDSVIVLPTQININVRSFLNLNRDILPLIDTDFLADSYKKLVIVDTRQLSRLKIVSHFIEKGITLHIYDHHPDQEGDITGDFELTEMLGANTTMLVEKIKKKAISLTELESTLLAMGIYEDTGYLTFTSTTKRDVAALSYLWELGINTDIIQEFLQRPLTAGQKTLFESLIFQSEFVIINQRKILFSWATSDEYIQGIAELVYRLSSIEEAEAAFCLVKMEGKVHVIARSFSDDINLLDLLSFWKVRGHPSATSIALKYDSVLRAREEITEILNLNLPFPLTAKDIASTPVKTVDINTSMEEASALLVKFGHSGFVVTEKSKIAGIISRKDFFKAQKHQLEHAPVKAFMNKNVKTASYDEPVSVIRQLMIENNIGRIPILDSAGDLYGIVTRSDVLRTFYQINTGILTSGITNKQKSDKKIFKKKNIDEADDLTLTINRELPVEIQKLLSLISKKAAEEKCQVYLVGGSIRDMLLGLSLPEDLDVAVIPEAIPFAFALNKILKGKIKVFEPFGTASIFLEKGLRLDLVTARKEFYASPASLPQVEASSLKNDLFRRDFSINTLACSLNENSFGKLYDFFGGRRDLQDGIIRILYQLSFVDDPLRILRAIRFEKRFDFIIEEETLNFLKQAIKNRILKRITRSRLNGEIRLIFRENDPPEVLKRLYELKLFPEVFPGLDMKASKWKLLKKVKDTLDWACLRDWEKSPDPEITYMSAMLYNSPLDSIHSLGNRLNYSREKIEKMTISTEKIPVILEELKKGEPGPGKIFSLFHNLPVETLLLLKTLGPVSLIKDYPQFYLDYLAKVKPALSGTDLKEMGLAPGPLFGKILKELQEAVLSGTVRSVEEERNFVLSYLDRESD